MIDIKSFCKLLEQYEYISFDVFDTLIFRTVSDYRAIHTFVGNRYSKIYGDDMNDYKKNRIKAESLARQKRDGKEVTMEMIYENLPYSNEKKKILWQLEEYYEIKNCVSNPIMVEIARLCKTNGKRVIITTDMYLSRFVFEQILAKIDVPYDRIFISGEEGVTKRSGHLFSVILTKLGIKANQIIHIGDDSNNDILQPQIKGIKSIERLCTTNNTKTYYDVIHKSLITDHLRCMCLHSSLPDNDSSAEWRLGYSLLGPLLFDFCKWIHEIKKKENIDKLLFVAREGYLIKTCYNLMYPNDDIGYIRLNKNMLRLPLMSLNNPFEYFLRARLGKNEYSWDMIFRMLHIDDHQKIAKLVKDKISTFDYDAPILNSYLLKGKYNDILQILFDTQKIKMIEQSEFLVEYINELGISNCKIGLVNNSMNGSGQSMLEDFMDSKGIKKDILGLQFIKTKNCMSLLNNRCRAWLSESSLSSYIIDKFLSYCLIFEHMLFEPCGTSLYLEKINNHISVVCEKTRTEQKDFDKINLIQHYAMDFVKSNIDNIQMNLAMEPFKAWVELLANPYLEDAELICNLNDDDIDGDKVISDVNIPFKRKFLLFKDIPKSILWVEGYFKIIGISKQTIRFSEYWLKCRHIKNIILGRQ